MPELWFERSLRTRAVDVGARRLDVTCASFLARLVWAKPTRLAGLGIALATPRYVWAAPPGRVVVPWYAGGIRGALAALLAPRGRADDQGELRVEEDDMTELERVGSLVGGAARPEEMVKALSTAASGAGAVGPVTTAGDRSVVPLVETMFGGGYGGGGGSEGESAGAGGGGGGFGRSRTVAVVDVTPAGMTIRPVIDKTAIVLASIAAGASLLGAFARRRR
ncbi:MAG: hypothetical protein ACRDY6_11865 [Acidimicrobiia bacterium]